MRASTEAEGWEALFWTAFERSANPMVLLDEQRRIVEVNGPTLALLGHTHGSLIGRSLAQVIAPHERARASAAWLTFGRTGEYSAVGTLLHADGAHVHVEFAAQMVAFPERRLALYVGLAHARSSDDRPGLSVDQALTAREREVVTLIALGEDTPGIARQLHISQETVKTHVRNAMRKLGVRSRAQLVAVTLARDATIRLPRPG